MRATTTRIAAPVLAIGISAIAVTGAGTAYAYWRTTANGSGQGSALAAGSVTLTAAGSVGGGKLFPGGSVPLNVTVTDPSTSKNMSITSVTPSVIAVGNATTPKGGVGSCGVTKVHWNPTPAFAPQAITAGGASVTINGTFSMDSDVEDACQNATFTLTVTVTGTMG